MHGITAISFDLDDTLWAIEPVIRRAERALWEWFGEHRPRVTERWSGEALQELRAAVMAEYPDQGHDLRFLRRRMLERILEACNYAADDAVIDAAFAVFDEHRNRVELFPDVIPGLQRLRERYRVIALTNGNASLQRIGIDTYFDVAVSAGEAGVAKPDRAIFELAATRAGVAPDAVLHVGDHPEIDVEGARAAGMAAAWMDRDLTAWPAGLAPPDCRISSVIELAEQLDRLQAAGV